MRKSTLLLMSFFALSSLAEGLSPELQEIKNEVSLTRARESEGEHNSAFSKFFSSLQSRFKEPKPDDDWMVDSHIFVGAQHILVERALNCGASAAGGEAFLVFGQQLKTAYIKRLKLPEATATAIACGVVSEARETAGLSASDVDLGSFKIAAKLLLASSHITDQCEVPYIAGYSAVDGAKIFIDRDVPSSIVIKGKPIPIRSLLNIHERVEKALLDEYQITYQHAHQIALRTERLTAKALDVNWADYDKYIMEAYDRILKRPTKWIPNSLDLRPYLSYDDLESYQLVSAMRANLIDPTQCPARQNP
jgi:hypothetical protein